MKNGSCIKCGSQNVIPRQRVVTVSGAESPSTMMVRFYEKLGTLKGKMHNFPITIWVCGDCGYAESFIAEPREFASVYRRIQQTQGQSADEDGVVSNKGFLILVVILGMLMLISVILIVILVLWRG